MKIPKKISPCPIAEALVELRFQPSPSTPIDAIFGLVFEKLRSEFPNVTNLPALSVPEQLRESDPNLKYQAHHRLANDTFSVSVGPRVLVFACLSPYAGWERFFGTIKKSLDLLLETADLIVGIERVGIRFVNFLNSALDESFDFSLSAPRLNVDNCQFHTTLIIPGDEFSNTVQLANRANLVRDNKQITGAVVDIDTFREDPTGGLKKDIYGVIDRAHECEKQIFFSLLREDVVKTLEPVY